MPQVIAWECPHTGDLFKSKARYDAHLRALSRDRAAARKEKREWEDIREAMAPLYRQTSLQGVVNWLQENPEILVRKAAFRNPDRHRRRGAALQLEIAMKLHWNERASNSHKAPFGEETNFCGQDRTLPSSFPGWQGRIDYHIRGVDGFEIFRGTGINTGTGGGHSGGRTGFESYGFDVILFAQDFPMIPQGTSLDRPNDWEGRLYASAD